ncbi:MAG: RDD family protein [Streptosporangiales bacterium]
MDRRSIGSWLGGPEAAEPSEYPGQRLGLPKEGSGSVPSLGRRIGGLFIDWLIASAIGYSLLRGGPWITLGVFALEHILLVGTLGFTIGHRVAGIRVVRVGGGGPPGPLRALVRTFSLCVFIPALLMDRDYRGLHDRAAGTVAVRF